jgi:hypothetical protein
MYLCKALTTVLLIWCLHVILLSKVTLRFITLFTKELSPHSVVVCLPGTLSGGINRLSFLFIDLYVPVFIPRIHCSEASFHFAQNMTLTFLCCVNTGIVQEQSKMSSRCCKGIIYT